MADRELQIKIGLAKAGLARDAAGAAAIIKDQLGDLKLDLPVDDSGVKLAEQAINKLAQETASAAILAGQLQEAYGLSPEEAAALTKEVQRLNSEAAKAEAAAEMKRVAEEAAAAQERIEQLNRGFASIAIAAGAVGAAIGGLFAKGLEQSADYQRTFLTLQQQIESTGGAVGITATELQAFASDLGNATLTSEEAVLRASRALLSFRSVTGDTFTRAITVSQDLAEVMGGDLESNIVQVGKALEDPVKGLTALSRSGTQFTQEQQDLIKSLVEAGDAAAAQDLILSELERQYGGAGLAAAQGLTGALDTLGEETNDLIRAFGDFATQGAIPLVNAAIALISTFNNLPGPIKTVLIGTTAFVGVLATATATLAAYNFASSQRIVQDALVAVSTAKKTVATVVETAATNAAAAAQVVYAAATGQATAAQSLMIASSLKLAATLGVAAGAVAAIALVAETFQRVTGPAREIDQAAREVDAAFLKIAESSSAASDGISTLGEGTAEANLSELQNSIGGVQRALDLVRGALGIDTAAEAAVNRSIVAFNNLISSTDDVRLAAAQVAVDLERGIAVDPAVVESTVQAIDQSIKALESQQPIKAEDIARTEAQIKALQDYRDRISATTAGTVALGDATGGLTDKIKEMSDALQLALGGINLDKLKAEAQILEDLSRGTITQAEADLRLANVGRLALEDTITAQRENLNKLRQLRAQAADGSTEALDLDKQILQAETAIAQARTGIAQNRLDAQEDAQDREIDLLGEIADRYKDLTTTLEIEQANQTRALVEGGKSQEEIAALERKFLQDRIDLSEKKLGELRAINQDALSSEEAAKVASEILSIEQELADDRLTLAEGIAQAAEDATKERLEQIESEQQAQQELLGIELDVAEQRLDNIDRVTAALENQLRVIDAQRSLSQALFDLESSLNDARREQLNEIINDEEASQREKENAARDLLRLTEEQFRAEKQQLEAQQELERQAFDLEAQRAALSEQREIRQQELALKRLELQRLEIQNEIELARIRGDDRAVQIGEAQLSLLGEQAALQQEYIASLQQQALLSAEISDSERNALLARQEQQDIALSGEQRQTAESINEQVSGLSSVLDRRGNRLQDAATREDILQQRQARNALPRLSEGINQQIAQMATAAAAGVGGLLSPQGLAQPIVAELQNLGGAINALAASPRQLTVQTPDPVADTSRILSDVTRLQTAGVNP